MTRKISQIFLCMMFGKILVSNELNKGITPFAPSSEMVALKVIIPNTIYKIYIETEEKDIKSL